MNKITISGKTNSLLEKDGIYGFSGAYLKPNSLVREPYFSLVENNYWKVFLFYNPADVSHHLPQDSLGMVFRDDQVLFAIADGVSIVGGTHDNLSGEVSLDLMKASLLQNGEAKYENIQSEYASKRLRGASTLQFGKISKSQLEAQFFGSIEDLGLSFYMNEHNKLIDFIVDGNDFFPQSWKVKEVSQNNIPLKGVVSTSDGVKLTEDNSLILLSILERESSEEEISQKLLNVLPYSPDDQSVILIIKR